MGHHPELATPIAGLYKSIGMKPLITAFLNGDRALTPLSPDSSSKGFQTDSPLILSPDFDAFVRIFST
jgi:hypothetical protein